MTFFVGSSGGSQQSGNVTLYQVGQASPSLPSYFGGKTSQPTTKTFPAPTPEAPADPFSPIPDTETEGPTMSRCGGTNATGSLPAGSGVISANPLGGDEINVTPGIVTTGERAREAQEAAARAQSQAQATAAPESWRALLESFGLNDAPPMLVLLLIVLTFAALRR